MRQGAADPKWGRRAKILVKDTRSARGIAIMAGENRDYVEQREGLGPRGLCGEVFDQGTEEEKTVARKLARCTG